MSDFIVPPVYGLSAPVETPARAGARNVGRSGGRALGDLGQELVVALGRPDLVHEEFQAGGGVAVGSQGVQDPTQLPHLLQLAPLEEELLVTGGTGVDVDG